MQPRPAGDVVPPHVNAEKLGSYMLTSTFAAGSLASLHGAQLLSAQGGSAGPCVVKRLLRQHVNDVELRELFLASGRAAMDISTPDVARTLLVHEDPEPFVVMEFVDGVNLRDLIQTAGGAETARLALPILLDALDGLQVLHKPRSESNAGHGLVHGAPCARHIMVGKDGLGRLVDFTHAVGPDLPWSPRRDERLKPSEMAPEQALAPAHVDPRCDLFILGAVLWQVLTGRGLFEGDAQGALQSMLRQPILAPSEAGAAVSRGLDRVCLRALQRARADRFASAGEMAAALRDAMQQAGLGAATREEIGGWVQSVVAHKQRAQRTQPAFGGAAGAAFRQARQAEPRPTLLGPQVVAGASHKVQTTSTLTIGTFAGPEGAPVDVRVPAIVDHKPARAGDQAPTRAGDQAPSRAAAGASAAALERTLPAVPSSVPDAIRSARASAAKWLGAQPSAPSEPQRAPAWQERELVSLLEAPAVWKEPAPSQPLRRKRARANKRAMAAGISIALGVPAIGLYLTAALPRAGDAPATEPDSALVELEPRATRDTAEAVVREGGTREEIGAAPMKRPADAPATPNALAPAAPIGARRAAPQRSGRARPPDATPAPRSAAKPTAAPAQDLPHNPYQ